MDFDEGDEPDVGPLPPQDDRLWRHPSELTDGPQAPTTRPRPRPVDTPASPPEGRRPWGLIIAAAAVGAAVGAGMLLALGLSDGVPDDVRETLVAPNDARDPAEIAEELLPAVVRIDVQRGSSQVTGAGVLFRDDGHVLTSGDLVAGADTVTAVFDSGDAVTATVVGVDQTSDIGVVRVEAEGRAGAPLGTPSALQEGEVAVAIIPPSAATTAPTIVKSVVAEVNADIEGDGWTQHGMLLLSSRADPLPPGSIIVDQGGGVVGVTTARRPAGGVTETTLTSGAPVEGADYATPVDFARRVADDLIQLGIVQHPWLGLDGEDVDASDGGVEVSDIAADGPAADAGIRRDDVIVAVDGRSVESMSDLVVELRVRDPGEPVELTYERDGERQRCQPVLEVAP